MTALVPAMVFGFDTETHLIAAGDIMPRLVCASFDIAEEGKLSPTSSILDTFRAWVTGNGDDHMGGLMPQLLAMFQECYARRAHIVIQNAAFDLCVLMRYCQDVIAGSQKGDPKRAMELFLLIWEAMEASMDSEMTGTGVWLHDTTLRQKLYYLSTVGMLDFQNKGRDISYGLDAMVRIWFDVDISGSKVTTGPNGTILDADGKDITGTAKAGGAWRLRYKELDGIPVSQWPPEAAQYAIDDATWARKGFEWQEARKQPRYHGSMNSESLQVYADTALRIFSASGFRIDPKQVAKVTAYVDAELSKSAVVLELNGIVRPNGTVCQAVLAERIKAAWEKLGRYPMLTPGGDMSASAEALEELDGVDPVLDMYSERSGMIKIKTGFLPNLTSGHVWSNYNVMVETGRTSSYGNSDKNRRTPIYAAVNIQQIPKKDGVRECFLPPAPILCPYLMGTDVGRIRIPDDNRCGGSYQAEDGTPMRGYVMCSTDYASLELCSVAQVTYTILGFSIHRDKINQGYDLHSYLGSGMALTLEPMVVNLQMDRDLAYQALVKNRRVQVPDADISPEAEMARKLKKSAGEWRNFAKPVGLGYPGGLGPATCVILGKTQYNVTMTEDQATTFRELWRGTYLEMPQYFQWVNKQTDPHFPGQDLYCYETQGFNRFRAATTYCATANGKAMQSLSADGAKRSVCWLARAMSGAIPVDSAYHLLSDCVPLAFIHDENLAGVPEDLLLTERALLQAQLMVDAMKVSMPDVRISCEPALMRRWTKAAEAVWEDQPGRDQLVRSALDAKGLANGVRGYADIVFAALGPSYKPNRRLVPWDDVNQAAVDKLTQVKAVA
jgi:hypothetical protein